MNNLHTVDLSKLMAVSSPGLFMNTKMMAPDVSIKMGDYRFLSSPMVLGDSDIDLILGWTGFLSTRLSLIVLPGRFN